MNKLRKNQKGISKILTILTVVGILIIVAGTVYYFFVFQKTGTSNLNQSINNDINQNATITNWKTYENTKYQYQIKYPADWPFEVDGIQVWADWVPRPEQGRIISFFNTNTEPDGQIGSVIISVNVNENPKKLSPRDYYTEILKNPIDSYGEEDPLLRYDLVDINFKGQQSLKITDKLHEESRHTIVAKGQLIYSIILSVDNFSNGEFHIPPEQIFEGILNSLTFTN